MPQRASRLHAYIVLCLLTGCRTEEARALRWDHVDLDGDPDAEPPVPPHVAVWRSVRSHGDVKTQKSRRTLRLPVAVVDALKAHKAKQAEDRLLAGALWRDHGLVFASAVGTPLDPSHVRRGFRKICVEAGIGENWSPRELRHTFVSIMSEQGVPVEEIARLVGHSVVHDRDCLPKGIAARDFHRGGSHGQRIQDRQLEVTFGGWRDIAGRRPVRSPSWAYGSWPWLDVARYLWSVAPLMAPAVWQPSLLFERRTE